MTRSIEYKGVKIEVTVKRSETGGWTGHATVLSEPPQDPIETASYASEAEALESAVQTAVQSIDRGRVSRGKP